MNRQYVQGIVEPLTKVVGIDKIRVSLALAVAIGYSLPVPATQEQEAVEWFQDQYRWKLHQFVGEFNERFLIDTQMVISGAQEIWLGRYRAVHVRDVTQIESILTGQTPASVFLAQYNSNESDFNTIAHAAFLLQDKITPVILDMTNPNATVK